ncbi:MAG: hypothetical protein MUO77_10970 [Anaerolineales bacterium]|nr:hypothetical protein [Anaerolineales bacterium]
MKNVSKKITLFCLIVILTSCNLPADKPTETPVTTTNLPTSIVKPEPIITPIPISMTPATLVMENGLTWTECVLPYRDYSYVAPDMELIASCLNMDFPSLDDNDQKIFGERVSGAGGGDNFRLIIGSDVYETRYTQVDATTYNYELLKNGTVIAQTNAFFFTFAPNRSLGNIGGKSVWEIIAEPPVIIVDGVNFNERYQLEGSFFPYEIKGKLLYIAQKNGRYGIVYDEKTIGPEFDEISMAYCCAEISVSYGKGQYWFLGRREETQFVVAIH